MANIKCCKSTNGETMENPINIDKLKDLFSGMKDEIDHLNNNYKTNLINNLDIFFHNIRFMLKIYYANKEKTDIYLASDFNIFENIISPDENKISDIIAFLLDPKESHGQKDIFYKKFVEILEIKQNINYEKLSISRESPTLYIENSRRRIDITIDHDRRFAIGIENKPWAGEQIDQIKDYSEDLRKEYKDNYILIYLSGNGSEPNSISKEKREYLKRNNKLKSISYSIELKFWLEECYKECKADKIRWLLNDLISYIEDYFRISDFED